MKNAMTLIAVIMLCAGPAAAGNRADVNADRAVNAADSVCLANILAGNLDASEFNLESIVVVAKQGGDFTDPADAADWVATQFPTNVNRFVILVAPGSYTLTRPITLPSYTTLRGYGPTNTVFYRTGGEAAPPYGALVVLSGTWCGAIESLQLNHGHGGVNFSAAIYNDGCYFSELRDCSIRMEQSVSFGAGIFSVGVVDLKLYNTQIVATQQWAPSDTSTTTAGIYMEADAADSTAVVTLTNSRVTASCNSGNAGVTREAMGAYLTVDSTSKQIIGDYSRLSAGSGTGEDWYLYRPNSGYGNFTLCYLGGGTNSTANLSLVGCVP